MQSNKFRGHSSVTVHGINGMFNGSIDLFFIEVVFDLLRQIRVLSVPIVFSSVLKWEVPNQLMAPPAALHLHLQFPENVR
jgi:hypothetical protein